MKLKEYKNCYKLLFLQQSGKLTKLTSLVLYYSKTCHSFMYVLSILSQYDHSLKHQQSTDWPSYSVHVSYVNTICEDSDSPPSSGQDSRWPDPSIRWPGYSHVSSVPAVLPSGKTKTQNVTRSYVDFFQSPPPPMHNSRKHVHGMSD